ncbi:hypothetical protein WMY93_025354 [Mugilogobius chulae]|uniref:SPX domain-containing protein n=1 Tax=Mugilogobius chulae TaxID=88201 RepID=A0AAW0N6M1_9GOBI
MKFAEHLSSHITPEWRKQYLQYEAFKDMLYAAQDQAPSIEEFETVRSEIQASKHEVVNNIALLRTELDSVKGKVIDMEQALTTCSDDVTELQTTVGTLQEEVKSLREKCIDMEGRMRRSNIRILNVPEANSSSPAAVTKLLTEVFKLDRDVLIDRSHRTAQLQQVTGKPRPIIARLHYYQDCVDILRRARQAGSALKYGQASISIFPDYAPSVARARSAFNEVKQLLRGRAGVRYGVIHPAKFRISHDGTEKDFMDPRKAMAYVKSSILASNG